MSTYANWNGKIVLDDEIKISPNNRSFRYGDGCFETIKVINGRTLLADLHFQRLFTSLAILRFTFPASLTANSLHAQILELVAANSEQKLSRIRLVVYRGGGGLYENEGNAVNYIIQSFRGDPTTNTLNQKGLILGFYEDSKKSPDLFSSIKSNNYLGYSMGAMWAKEKGYDDCIICNAFDRVADATIANIFIVQNGVIKTPLTTEGCINGVMRAYLLASMSKEGVPYLEQQLTPKDVLDASEVFLTNANYGIRWVQKVGNTNYSNSISSILYNNFIHPLFNPDCL